MLEALDTIDWGNLQHASGPAIDVPDLIRALASDDEEERESAMSELYENIWHQDTVYEATAYAVPFLIELLSSDRVPSKNEILVLLGSLASGSSSHSQAIHQKQAHDAVACGAKIYVTLLDHHDPDVRGGALYTLFCLPEHASEVLPLLQRHLESERNQHVRASLLLCMWSFSPNLLREYRPLFQERMKVEGESSLVKLAAAMALIRSAEDAHALSPEAMQTVVEAILHPEEIEPVYEALPWMQSGFIADIGMLLCNLPPAAASAALSICFKALAPANYWRTIDLVSTILLFTFESVVFGFASGDPGPTRRRLTEAQRTALATLIACDRLWETNAHMAAIMKECNIPGGREQLRFCLENPSGRERFNN
jgi:hypothetical protein